MRVNDLVKAAHNRAVKSGWWDTNNPPERMHMLMVTEIAEATEAVRNDQDPFFFAPDGKPEGEAVELVDAVIRIADYFGQRGWDMETIISAKMAYNETRPHRHGDKKF